MKKNSEQNRFGSVFNKLLNQLGEPVDFELPDWVKIRTTQYTHIKRNIYLTKKNKRKFDHGIFCSCEPSSESTGVCGRDCHCGMLLSSCSSACKCGISCLNKAFQNRPVKKMKLVKTEKCGSGIVADEDIKLGEFVIEYVGEVIDDKTCEQRLWNMKDRGETNFYLCEITRDMVIDATYKGNKSRYINHSCCPNTEMQKWIIDGETRIGIFATRDIRKGEHLTYDYQFVQFGADQDCHCGAVQCRRKLGARPTKPKVSSDAALKLVAYQFHEFPHHGIREILMEMQRAAMQRTALLGCVAASLGMRQKSFALGHHVCQNGGMQGVHIGSSRIFEQSECLHNCVDEVIMIKQLGNVRFGIIKWFDEYSRKHKIMFEDGRSEICDMSKEDWELVRL